MQNWQRTNNFWLLSQLVFCVSTSAIKRFHNFSASKANGGYCEGGFCFTGQVGQYMLRTRVNADQHCFLSCPKKYRHWSWISVCESGCAPLPSLFVTLSCVYTTSESWLVFSYFLALVTPLITLKSLFLFSQLKWSWTHLYFLVLTFLHFLFCSESLSYCTQHLPYAWEHQEEHTRPSASPAEKGWGKEAKNSARYGHLAWQISNINTALFHFFFNYEQHSRAESLNFTCRQWDQCS